MKWPDIDVYVSSFEELLQLAEYTAGNNESANLFLRGLPRSIATEVMKPPLPTGYEEMKRKAIDATRLSQIIQSMFGNQGNSRGSRLERGKLAKCTSARKTTASTIFPMSSAEYEGVDPTGHLHQSKLYPKLDTSGKLLDSPSCF